MILNLKGKATLLPKPAVMGILNITPDSFYASSRLSAAEEITQRAAQMLEQGAAILDIGGMSSRPGAEIISPQEELSRVLPAVELIAKQFREAIISIDTIHASVAEACLQAGAHIVNDISGGRYDAAMLRVVAQHKAPFVIMHMQGLPQTMQQQPTYKNVSVEVMQFFDERIKACLQAGLTDLILDPGFGFGKTLEHNYELLNKMPLLTSLGFPLLVGVSRKSMITKLLGVSANEALNGTTALNTIALMQGAAILRVHDVKEAMQTVAIYRQLKAATS